MEQSVVIILLINLMSAFSQTAHEFSAYVGCFSNGTHDEIVLFDGQEVLFIDFLKNDVIPTLPKFLDLDLSPYIDKEKLLDNAGKHKNICQVLLSFVSMELNEPPQEIEVPDSVLYASEEIQLGIGNMLICHVYHLYPPSIRFSWTKNGHLLTDGISVSRYYANNDHTFQMFSTLTLTPLQGDTYSCTIEHPGLEKPLTRFWEPDVIEPSLGPDVYCGVGLTVAFIGVAVGTFLIAKGHLRQRALAS